MVDAYQNDGCAITNETAKAARMSISHVHRRTVALINLVVVNMCLISHTAFQDIGNAIKQSIASMVPTKATIAVSFY